MNKGTIVNRLEKEVSLLERDIEKSYRNFKKPKKAINEAFKAGTSAKVAEKMYKILSRRLGKNFIPSDYPTEFSNKEGKFLGYYATFGNQLTRINFLLSGSDHVHSIDIFSKNVRVPDKTIQLMGFNIVQVIDQISDVFDGSYEKFNESTYLSEAIKYTELMKMWIEEEGNDRLPEDVERERVSVDTEFRRFSEFCEQNGRKAPKHIGAFLRILKEYVVENLGGRLRIPSVEVTPGRREEPINSDAEAEEGYNELFQNQHLLKFRTLEYYVNEVGAGNPDFQGIYVYGDGGVGKSYLAKKYLASLSNTFYLTGKIAGYTGLVKLLFDHREGEILVLDDTLTTNDMKNTTIQNILKGALDPEPPRRIQVKSTRESYARTKNGILEVGLNESDMRKYKKSLKEETEIVDFTDISGMETPSDFQFNSRVVFLTNYPDIPDPLKDRCYAVEMIFSNEQILDIIEVNVAKLAPDRIPETRELFQMTEFTIPGSLSESDESPFPRNSELEQKEVLNFMRDQDAQGLVKRKYSIRIFKRLLSLYLATKHTPSWKQLLAMELSS